MFDDISPRYDLLNSLLSLGLHRLWERRLISELPNTPPEGRALDLCTGTGALVPYLVKRYAEVVGVDIAPQMLEVAKRRWGQLSAVSWVEGDAQALKLPDRSFDVVTVAYGVRNWPDFNRGLGEVFRVLKPGGCVGVLEFGQPNNSLWRWGFNIYSRYVIPNLGGLISGNREAYRYLHRTAGVFPCGERFLDVLKATGFKQGRCVPLAGGVAFVYLGVK